MTTPPSPSDPPPAGEPPSPHVPPSHETPSWEPQSYEPPQVAELPGDYVQPPIQPEPEPESGVTEQPSPYGPSPYGPPPSPYGPQPYPQQPYPQQAPYGQAYNPYNPYSAYAPPKGQDNGLAIGALVCSVLGFCTCVTALPGLIMGHLALSKASRGESGGRSLALAAVVVGYVVVALVVGFTTTTIILGANGKLD